MPEKLRWNNKSLAEFKDWMHNELHNALGDRNELETSWALYIEQYVARRPEGVKDIPWVGSSNEELPITGMHVDPVYADLMQSIHAPPNFWTVIPHSPDWVNHASPITEYMALLDRKYLRMRKVNRKAFLDLCVLGMCVHQHGWQFERRRRKAYGLDGKITDDVQILNQPLVRHVPLTDFIWPSNAWNLDPDAMSGPASWTGHRFKLTQNQLRARAEGQEPFLPNYDKEAVRLVLEHETQESTKVEEKVQDVDRLPISQDLKVELFELWARFDTDNDGIDEDIVVVWHQGTDTILRAIYNPFAHGHRPYEISTYQPGFGLVGFGIAQLDEWAQAVGSKLFNATVDNALLANTRMYAIPLGSMIRPDEPIYPGKIWPLGPGEQIQEIRLGEVYPSMFQLMGLIQNLSELRTGISELRTGNVTGLPSRTPATTVTSLLREGSKRFDRVMSDMREDSLSNVGKRTFQNVVQMSRTDPKWKQLAIKALGERDGGLVADALGQPVDRIDEELGFQLTATSGLVNKEIEKQNLLGLMQIMGQAYPQLIQAAQIANPQLVPQIAAASFRGGVELIRRLLEAFEIQNPEQYLPEADIGISPNGMQQQMPQQPLAGQLNPDFARLLGL